MVCLDSNPGWQNGRRRRIHWAMVSSPLWLWTNFSFDRKSFVHGDWTRICCDKCHLEKPNLPASILFIFGLFDWQYYFTTNEWEIDPSSIWCQDSNLRLLDRQSPLITTRLACTSASVTRFGEIFKAFGQNLYGLFCTWQTIEPTLAFSC